MRFEFGAPPRQHGSYNAHPQANEAELRPRAESEDACQEKLKSIVFFLQIRRIDSLLFALRTFSPNGLSTSPRDPFSRTPHSKPFRSASSGLRRDRAFCRRFVVSIEFIRF